MKEGKYETHLMNRQMYLKKESHEYEYMTSCAVTTIGTFSFFLF